MPSRPSLLGLWAARALVRIMMPAAEAGRELRRSSYLRSSEKDWSMGFGPNVVTSHVPDPTPDERSCLPCLFRQALADPWHQRAQRPGSARLQAPSVSPGDDPVPLALVRL